MRYLNNIEFDFNLGVINVDGRCKLRVTQEFSPMHENRFYGLFPGDVRRDKSAITRIDMVGNNANQCKVLSDGFSVYTNAKVYPGDIIEICPTKVVDKSSLYSKDMRDIVFEVVPHETFVIPFGYCQYYDIADEHNHANCEFTWNPERKTIVIQALERMPARTKLYLNTVK